MCQHVEQDVPVNARGHIRVHNYRDGALPGVGRLSDIRQCSKVEVGAKACAPNVCSEFAEADAKSQQRRTVK